ncbi:MAG TPA: hypothetical protein VKP69_00150, partial [Isosphaeraceae bacterium]|nr:hypothetical protein [Isosphaeraceae bacterium]
GAVGGVGSSEGSGREAPCSAPLNPSRQHPELPSSNLLKAAGRLRAYSGGKCPRGALLEAKELGFSDYQVGKLLGCDEQEARETRKVYGLAPVVKQTKPTGPAKTESEKRKRRQAA